MAFESFPTQDTHKRNSEGTQNREPLRPKNCKRKIREPRTRDPPPPITATSEETMASSSSSVHAQIIDGSSSSESNSMETDSNGVPFEGVLFSRECRSSDEFSISYCRKFPKSTGQNLQGSLQTVKSTVALYGFSCELNMDNWYGEMTFTTSRTNSKENIDRATTALHLLQLNVPTPTALKVFSGSFSDIILTGDPGLCSRFSIKPTQLFEGIQILRQYRQDLERLTSCDICMGEGIVIIVGSSEGVRIVGKIVQDCIVHNVHPVRWVTTFKRVLAMKRLEATSQLQSNSPWFSSTTGHFTWNL